MRSWRPIKEDVSENGVRFEEKAQDLNPFTRKMLGGALSCNCALLLRDSC